MLVRMSFTITMSIFFAGWICCIMFGCNDQLAASSVEPEIQRLQALNFTAMRSQQNQVKSGWDCIRRLTGTRLSIRGLQSKLFAVRSLAIKIEKTGKPVSVDEQMPPLSDCLRDLLAYGREVYR